MEPIIDLVWEIEDELNHEDIVISPQNNLSLSCGASGGCVATQSLACIICGGGIW